MGIRIRAGLTALAMLAPLVLAACIVREVEEEKILSFFELLRTEQYEAAQDMMIPALQTPEARDTLQDLRQTYVPPDEPDAVAMVHSQFFNSFTGGGRTVTTVHQYDYPDRVLAVRTTLVQPRAGGEHLVQGIYIDVIGGEFLTRLEESYQKALREANEGGDADDGDPEDGAQDPAPE